MFAFELKIIEDAVANIQRKAADEMEAVSVNICREVDILTSSGLSAIQAACSVVQELAVSPVPVRPVRDSPTCRNVRDIQTDQA